MYCKARKGREPYFCPYPTTDSLEQAKWKQTKESRYFSTKFLLRYLLFKLLHGASSSLIKLRMLSLNHFGPKIKHSGLRYYGKLICFQRILQVLLQLMPITLWRSE